MSSPLGGSLIAAHYRNAKSKALLSNRKRLKVGIQLEVNNICVLSSCARVYTDTEASLQSSKAVIFISPRMLSGGLIQLKLVVSFNDEQNSSSRMISQYLVAEAGESVTSLIEGNANTRITVCAVMD